MTGQAYEAVKVLDHGYVRLVRASGSDEEIIEAARMSTDKGFVGWGPTECAKCKGTGKGSFDLPAGWLGDGAGDARKGVEGPCDGCHGKGYLEGDEKLLRYLYQNRHMTPFEMTQMVVEVQAPIFVFREWHRHRTQSYNELSARYTALPDLFYVPSIERLMASRQDQINKQGSGGQPFNDVEAGNRRVQIIEAFEAARATYVDLLNMGVAREVARLVIPVAQYSRMRAAANLRNWLAFLTLRQDKAAQWEIRQYANVVADLVRQHYPRTYALYIGS